MERCRVSNRVSHWEDNSTKAEPSCFGPVVNTKSVFSRGDAQSQTMSFSVRPGADP
jgi:hypothetical protein